MAEEIGYGIIGEERKDPENVIDYNINSEQTKDAFAEINANNQTTTGMANVIPGINAPKLLAKTSIIGGGGGGGGGFNARVIYITTSPTVDDAQTILDSYLEGYWTIVVQNISDAAYRYFYQGYMHYNHLVFVFNGEQGGRMEMRINYSGTTATGIIVS